HVELRRVFMAQASGKLQEVEVEQEKLVPKDEGTVLVRWQGRIDKLARFLAVRYWLFCLLVGGVALGFNLYRLGSQSMWFDEILSVERARQSLPTLLQIIWATQPNMALYYVF